MSHLTINQILKLSRAHKRTHAQYEEGHCPVCYSKDLDHPDFRGQAKFKIKK